MSIQPSAVLKPRSTTVLPWRISHGTVASNELASPFALNVPETVCPSSGAVTLTRARVSSGSPSPT